MLGCLAFPCKPFSRTVMDPPGGTLGEKRHSGTLRPPPRRSKTREWRREGIVGEGFIPPRWGGLKLGWGGPGAAAWPGGAVAIPFSAWANSKGEPGLPLRPQPEPPRRTQTPLQPRRPRLWQRRRRGSAPTPLDPPGAFARFGWTLFGVLICAKPDTFF